MIDVILGKRGSGKSTLSKELMIKTGGKVVYLSPVEKLQADYEIWELKEIPVIMKIMKSGEICVVKRADVRSAEMVAVLSIALQAEGPYTLVVDEMEKYAKSKHLLDVIHYGRHFGINLIANSRRYTDLPRLLTSQSDNLYIFHTIEPRDLQYIQEFAGKEAKEIVQKLDNFHYLVYPSMEIKKTIIY